MIFILFCISMIIVGGSYFTWKYFTQTSFLKIKPPINDSLKEEMIAPLLTQPVHYEDISTYPYFDINIDNNPVGRIIFQLFDEEVPITCKNFRYLCSYGIFDKNKPSYQDTSFHRVIKDFMIQGGDITRGDGTGGYSMYGEQFADENFLLTHNQPGMLSMANSGPNTNNSQFFITLKKTPWLDHKHVVFGIIISGFDIVKKIEDAETDETDKPIQKIIIVKSGLLSSLDVK